MEVGETDRSLRELGHLRASRRTWFCRLAVSPPADPLSNCSFSIYYVNLCRLVKRPFPFSFFHHQHSIPANVLDHENGDCNSCLVARAVQLVHACASLASIMRKAVAWYACKQVRDDCLALRQGFFVGSRISHNNKRWRIRSIDASNYARACRSRIQYTRTDECGQ